MNKPVYKKFFPQTMYGRILLAFFTGLFFLFFLMIFYFSAVGRTYYLSVLLSDRARYAFTTYSLLNFATPEERIRLIGKRTNKRFRVTLSHTKPVFPVGNSETSQDLKDYIQILLKNSPTPLNEDIEISTYVSSISDIQLLSTFADFFFDRPDKHEIHSSIDFNPQHITKIALPFDDGTWVTFDGAGVQILIPTKLSLIVPSTLFLIVSLLSVYAVYMAMQPLKRLKQTTEKFSSNITDYQALAEEGPTEVRETIRAFNILQKRIFDFVNERSRLLAAISHDLRTPLTRMALRTAQLEEPLKTSFSNDINQLRQLMDTSIDLARATGNAEKLVPMDLISLIESMTEDLCVAGHDVEFCYHALESSHIKPIRVRPLCLKRALTNLLGNAVRYASKTKIYIINSNKSLQIKIIDNGPGIPAEQLEKVFEPFYRVEPSRNRSTGGTGLGLAITRSMLQLCNGSVQLTNNPEGGLTATVTLKR